jgi:hypothetical protein
MGIRHYVLISDVPYDYEDYDLVLVFLPSVVTGAISV